MRILALFLCAAALAQQPPAFQSESKVVLVDAVVTGRKGEYIRDLTAKDFRIWEDNKEQTLASFSLEATSSPAEPRRLVLFFDDVGMSLPEQAGARQAAARFIDASSSPDRLMAVITFDGTLHIAGDFTANPSRLKDLLHNARLNAPNTDARSQAQAAARALVPAVATMAQYLDAAPGRKIIVLLTGRRSLASPRSADVANLIQVANRSNVAVYPVIQSGSPQAASAAGADAEQQGQVSTRRGVQAPRGTNGRGADDDDIPLSAQADDSIARAIARGTGGFVLSDSNDLVSELQRVATEQRQYYVLSYAPPPSKDGACHTLRVKVDRRDTEVRARSGYCTEKSQDLLAQSPVEKDLEKRAAAEQTGASNGAIQTPYFYIAPNLARVHAVMEIPTAALKFENQKGKLHAEMNILGLATAPDGAVAARFSDIVRRTFDSKDELDKWKTKPLYYAKEFKIVPGAYTLTVVFNSGSENFGKFTSTVNVPAFEGTTLAISGIALSTEVKPATALGLEASLIDDGTPLVAGGETVIPAASNAFTKAAPAYCYFEIYTPGANEAATVHLRILDPKTGASKWEGNASTSRIHHQPSGRTTIPVGFTLPIADLSPGAYRLEVTAADGPDKTAGRSADFEIR